MSAVVNVTPLDAHTKAAVRAVLDTQGLGAAWIAASTDQVEVVLEQEPAGDVPVMLARGEVERVTRRSATISHLGAMSPARQDAVRKTAERI